MAGFISRIGGSMVTTEYCSAYGNKIHHQLICGCCGKYLGSYDIEDGKEYNDIKGWVFCPYCGRELEQESD